MDGPVSRRINGTKTAVRPSDGRKVPAMKDLLLMGLLGLGVLFAMMGLATAHVWMVPRDKQPKRRIDRKKGRPTSDQLHESLPESDKS